MTRRLPPLAWFRAFEAAARRLSFTAAAEELGLTQSAVSQNVRALESRLGAPLFVRLPRGLALTDDGRKLLPQVGAALDKLAAATEAYDVGPTRDLLTIATSVSVAQWILAPRLRDFLARRPDARLRIVGAIWPDDFNASIADLEIRFGSEAQVGADATRLSPDRLIAVSQAGSDAPLETRPLIEAVGDSAGWRQWAAATGYPAKLEAALQVDSYGLALDLAMHGAGVALTSSLLAADALGAGRLVLAHPASIESAEGYFLSTRRVSGLARDFERWLVDALASRSAAP